MRIVGCDEAAANPIFDKMAEPGMIDFSGCTNAEFKKVTPEVAKELGISGFRS